MCIHQKRAVEKKGVSGTQSILPTTIIECKHLIKKKLEISAQYFDIPFLYMEYNT